MVTSPLLAALLAAAAGSPSPRRAPAPAPPPLLWPLEFDEGLAASFGELRGDRLHTGVDLRTRGETGWPVRAVDAGRVVRLKEEYRGYGLALYLEHPSGLTSVYAHLERVAPDLERRLAEARRGRGTRWAGDVPVEGGRAVARGEVVAWSGESGAGLPHLHLELRRGMDGPVDPFAAGLAPPRDDLPPVAEQLVVEPASPGALVNGADEAVTVELRGGRGAYRADEVPVVRGPVRLLLRAHDRAGAENWAGVGALRARLDGEPLYALAFDAIPFAASGAAGAVLDLARSHLSPSWYAYRLTRLPGADVPYAQGREGALALAPGRHRLEVELSDAVTTLGPRTRVALELLAEEAPPDAAGGDGAAAAAGVLVDAERGGRLEREGFALVASPGDAWAPVRVEARDHEPALPAGLVLAGTAVALRPDGHPFRGAVELRFDPRPSAPPAARLGVYRLDAFDGSWDVEDAGTTARVRRLATYALLADEAPPVVHATVPQPGAAVPAGEATVEARVTDLGSGIEEHGVRLSVDGALLEELYDPDRDRARAPWTATPGAHVLRVEARDRAGNVAAREVRFSVAAARGGRDE